MPASRRRRSSTPASPTCAPPPRARAEARRSPMKPAMTALRSLLLAAALATSCGGGDAPVPGPVPATPTPTAGGAVPLVDWVADLVDHFEPNHVPDTVDDKNVAD